MNLPKAIICDLDGTLALIEHRSPYDASTAEQDILNNPIANILHVYSHQTEFPIDIILLSGRDEKYRRPTAQWLEKHGIIYKEFINPIEHSLEETSDSCPKCGNPLATKQENGKTIKYCITESFEVASGKVTHCGYWRSL